MNKYYSYPTRDPVKNYSPMPNEVYYLSLSYGAIAVYGYLLHIENRKTYQSYASYNTIGRAVKMSANTVRKYVSELEEKQLIRTEPTPSSPETDVSATAHCATTSVPSRRQSTTTTNSSSTKWKKTLSGREHKHDCRACVQPRSRFQWQGNR